MTDNARIVREALAFAEQEGYITRDAIIALTALESELATAKADLARAREAIQNHGLHNYACAHVGASRESAMFEGRPIPACDCWMSAALAPEQASPDAGGADTLTQPQG